MAAGSQLIINKDGISITTPYPFSVHAGQHIFETGEQVKAQIPILPTYANTQLLSNKWDFYDLFYQTDFAKIKYKLINNHNNSYMTGTLDTHGRTHRITRGQVEDYDLLIGPDLDWNACIDDEGTEYFFEHQCAAYQHDNNENSI